MEWKLPEFDGGFGAGYALKPSLVEWKLGFHLCIRFPEATALETFLGGMETFGILRFVGCVCALKPSLVGWKQARKEGWA